MRGGLHSISIREVEDSCRNGERRLLLGSRGTLSVSPNLTGDRPVDTGTSPARILHETSSRERRRCSRFGPVGRSRFPRFRAKVSWSTSRAEFQKSTRKSGDCDVRSRKLRAMCRLVPHDGTLSFPPGGLHFHFGDPSQNHNGHERAAESKNTAQDRTRGTAAADC